MLSQRTGGTSSISNSFFGATINVSWTVPSGYSYTISNISADHSLVLDDVGTFVTYDVSASSSYNGATVTPATQTVREGRSATVNIAVNNLYEIVVKDNGTNVTSSLVQNSTGYTYTTGAVNGTHNITVEEATYYTVSTSSSYAGASATANPSKVYAGRSSVVSFTFNHLYEFIAKDNGVVIDIPEPVPSTSSNYIPSSYITSASSTYAIVTSNPTSNGLTDSASTTYCLASANTGTNAETYLTYAFDCSAIPENAVIESVTCSVKAGVSNTSYLTTRYAQLYCGDSEKGNQSSSLAQFSTWGTDPTAISFNGGSWTREELNDVRIRIYAQRGTSNVTSNAAIRFYGATLAVTYSVPAAYTLTNVQTDHAITIEKAPTHSVTVSSTYAGATGSVSPADVFDGIDCTVTINVTSITEIVVKDNGTDVTSSLGGGSGAYTYTLSSVHGNHAITIEEAQKYTLTSTSNYPGATISPASVVKHVTENADFIIDFDGDIDLLSVKDNGVEVSGQLEPVGGTVSETFDTSCVLGTFDDNSSNYLGIYNNYVATNAEGKSTADGIASTAATRSSFYPASGEGSTLEVVYNFDTGDLSIPEGAVIVSVSGSVACSLAFFGTGYTSVVGQIYADGNAKGVPTTIGDGTALADTQPHEYALTGGTSWTRQELYNAKIKLTGVRTGTNSSGDTSGQRDNVNIHGADLVVTYGFPSEVGGYQYTVVNVQTGHTIVVSEFTGSTYDVSASSTYSGATVSPATKTIREGKSTSVEIRVTNLYEIKVKDNGVDVTDTLTGNGGVYFYTVSNISANHTVVVEEADKISVTASSVYAGATITPALLEVYKGLSATFDIGVSSVNLITLLDNGVDVTNSIVYISGETFEATGGTLGTFDETNSDYVGIYNNYVATNAEGNSASYAMANTASTRSSFYPATGSGQTLTVVYNFDVSQITMPSETAIMNVKADVVVSVAYSGQGYTIVTAQLYANGEAKGEATIIKEETATTMADASAHTYTLNGGSNWDQSDLNNAKVYLFGIRNDTNSNNENTGVRDNVNIHGADLSVEYNYLTAQTEYTYTVNNVTTGHTLVLREIEECTVNATSYVQGVTITPATNTTYERDTIVLNITGDLTDLIVLDNGIDVTTAIRSAGESAYTYTISNIHGNHTVVVSEPSNEHSYIRVSEQYKRVRGYYRKVSGEWQLISQESFNETITANTSFYGGEYTFVEVGEVTESNGRINIVIDDNALTADTYTLKYEDDSRQPLEGIDNITDFTIQ